MSSMRWIALLGVVRCAALSACGDGDGDRKAASTACAKAPCESSSAGSAAISGVDRTGGAAGRAALPEDNFSAEVQCKTNPQSGCPSGSVCLVANAAGETSCYSTGDVTYSGACTSINDCQAGLLCVYGQCRTQCTRVTDCRAPKYATCEPYPGQGSVGAIPGSSFCSLQCNPADPANAARDPDLASCMTGGGCYSMGSEGPTGGTSCYKAGTAARGATCKNSGDCSGGLVCLTSTASATSGTCTPYCVKGKTQCTSGSCLSFGKIQYVGLKGSLVELGYCG